jgi:hypothetical protein
VLKAGSASLPSRRSTGEVMIGDVVSVRIDVVGDTNAGEIISRHS